MVWYFMMDKEGLLFIKMFYICINMCAIYKFGNDLLYWLFRVCVLCWQLWFYVVYSEVTSDFTLSKLKHFCVFFFIADYYNLFPYIFFSFFHLKSYSNYITVFLYTLNQCFQFFLYAFFQIVYFFLKKKDFTRNFRHISYLDFLSSLVTVHNN